MLVGMANQRGQMQLQSIAEAEPSNPVFARDLASLGSRIGSFVCELSREHLGLAL